MQSSLSSHPNSLFISASPLILSGYLFQFIISRHFYMPIVGSGHQMVLQGVGPWLFLSLQVLSGG